MRIATNGVPEKVLREEKVSSQLHYKLYEYGRYLLPEITFSNKLHWTSAVNLGIALSAAVLVRSLKLSYVERR